MSVANGVRVGSLVWLRVQWEVGVMIWTFGCVGLVERMVGAG